MNHEDVAMQILLQLKEDQHKGNRFERPYGVTMTGLVENVRASKGVTSIVVNNLLRSGFIDYDVSHPVKDKVVLKQRVRCYRITINGVRELQRMVEEVTA